MKLVKGLDGDGKRKRRRGGPAAAAGSVKDFGVERRKKSREEVPLSFGVLLSTGVAAAAQSPGIRVRLSRVTQAYRASSTV